MSKVGKFVVPAAVDVITTVATGVVSTAVVALGGG